MKFTIPLFKASGASAKIHKPYQSPFTKGAKAKRHCLGSTLFILVTFAIAPDAITADHHANNPQWGASWAASPAAYFVYAAPIPQNQALGSSPTRFARASFQPDLAFPFPNAKTTGATAVNQTIRSIVKPDLWGNKMRIRLSNVFGNKPVNFDATTVALQEYAGNVGRGTVALVTFGGAKTVVIPPGHDCMERHHQTVMGQ